MCIAELQGSQSQSKGSEEGPVIPLLLRDKPLLLQNKPPVVEEQDTGKLPDLHLYPDTVRKYSRCPRMFTTSFIEHCFK